MFWKIGFQVSLIEFLVSCHSNKHIFWRYLRLNRFLGYIIKQVTRRTQWLKVWMHSNLYLLNFLKMAGMDMKVLVNFVKEQLKVSDMEELKYILKTIFTFHWVPSLTKSSFWSFPMSLIVAFAAKELPALKHGKKQILITNQQAEIINLTWKSNSNV